MTRFAAILCAGVALVAGGYALTTSSAPFPALVSMAHAQEAADIDTSTIVEMTMGDPEAPIKMVEYASFTCPHCKDFHKSAFQDIKKDYIDTGKVHFTYREVYFDRYGLWASMVARCGGPEKFFGISDMIYDGQSEWTRAGGPAEIADELRKIGRLAGIDSEELEACLLDGTKAQTLVAWYQENAEADGVTATPSFVVNGKKVSNQSYAEFKTLLDSELGN